MGRAKSQFTHLPYSRDVVLDQVDEVDDDLKTTFKKLYPNQEITEDISSYILVIDTAFISDSKRIDVIARTPVAEDELSDFLGDVREETLQRFKDRSVINLFKRDLVSSGADNATREFRKLNEYLDREPRYEDIVKILYEFGLNADQIRIQFQNYFASERQANNYQAALENVSDIIKITNTIAKVSIREAVVNSLNRL